MQDQRPSKKQRELLSFIDGFIQGNGYGPSYREIMRALDYKSVSTVAVHVDGLIARGLLRKRDHSARSLEVVGSTDGGKSVENRDETDHETWLVGIVDKKIDAYKAAPSVEILGSIKTLLAALLVLDLHVEHERLAAKLAKIEKT